MDGFIGAKLSDEERLLADRVALGQSVSFSASPGHKPRIRASLIRHLLLGGPVPRAGHAAAHVEWPGVRISGASIAGPLDLADGARPGMGLPTLALEDCDILEPLDFSAARLARLSLARSRFKFVNLREADIDGPFDFSGVAALTGDECWIDARDALFGGELNGAGAKLQTPEARHNVPIGDRRTALWLAGATIRGNLELTTEFRATGGISIDGAEVHGDVVVADAMISAGEDDAIRAQNASVDGVMVLHRFRAEGVIWLPGLRTRGHLQVSDAHIHGAHPASHGTRHAPHEEQMALIVSDADVGGSMRLTPGFVARGLVSFAVSKVRGQIDVTDAICTNWSADGRARAINGTNADIGASLVFDRAAVTGRLDIAGARIGGRLSFLHATLSNRTPDSIGKALEAQNITVGGNAEFGYHRHDEARHGDSRGERGARVEGAIDLTGARVGGDLVFTTATIENPPPEPAHDTRLFWPNSVGIALLARQVQVQASVVLNGGFVSHGALILTGATIRRDLVCQNASLRNPERSALYAKDIEVGDDLKLRFSGVMGDLRFERAAVTGSVIWEDLTLGSDQHRKTHDRAPEAQTDETQPSPWRRAARRVRDCWWHARRCTRRLHTRWRVIMQHRRRRKHKAEPKSNRIARFELVHARIGTSLKCAGVNFARPYRIDLTGVRVMTLDLSTAHGWGRSLCQDTHCPIGLDGLVYERLVFPDVRPEHVPDRRLRAAAGIPTNCWRWAAPPSDPLADRLLDWTLRDASNGLVRTEQSGLVVVSPSTAPRHHFNPQPYRQLSRILRTQGYEPQARYIAIAEQWAMPRRNTVRLLHMIYGICFGFGLSPRRAIMTLSGYVVLGTLLAWVALHGRLMVETPLIAASHYTDKLTPDDNPGYRAFISADGRHTRADLTCRDLTDSLFDSIVYAADTVLPFIPLHEETKCELKPDEHVLRFFRAAYTLVGWIVTSLALITVSGILKRFDREAG